MANGTRQLDPDGKRKLTSAGKRSLAGCCCCNLCCGRTPKDFDLVLAGSWWGDFQNWFNNLADPSYRTLAVCEFNFIIQEVEFKGYWEARAKDVQVTNQAKLGCNALGTLYGTGTCAWGGIFEAETSTPTRKAFFEKRWLPKNGPVGKWQDVFGHIEAVASVTRNDDGVRIDKHLTIYLRPDLTEDLWIASSPNHLIFRSVKTVECPHNCAVSFESYDNQHKSYAVGGSACFPVDAPSTAPVAPGSATLSAGKLGCNRPDCSGDCGAVGGGECLSFDQYASTCQDTSFGDPWIVAETNTLFSAFDGLFKVTASTGTDPAGWSTTGADAPPLAYLNCEKIGSKRYWRAGIFEDGYAPDTGLCRAEGLFEALPNGCPPLMIITAANATIWQMSDNCAGVTQVRLQVSYL